MSTYTPLLEQLESIHYWANLEPNELHYARYDTNIIFTIHKIIDTYWVLSMARNNLYFLDNKNWGDYSRDNDERTITYLKTLHIQNALMYYNIAVDYSWQILWLYYDSSLSGQTPTNDLYEKCMAECNYEELLYRLTLRQDIKMRDNIVKEFFNKNKAYEIIRPNYNYMKHRGAFNFEEMKFPSDRMVFTLTTNDGKTINPHMVSRRTLRIDESKSLLIEFDKSFISYMSSIIYLLVPQNYSNIKMEFEELVNLASKFIPH